MRRLLVLLCLSPLLAVAAEAAQPAPPAANQRAEKEARSFLRPCPSGPDQKLCLTNQQNFIEQYVYAKSGDRGGQSSTSASFDTDHVKAPDDNYDYLGLPQNQIQSCAWRIVMAQSADTQTGDTAIVSRKCGLLDHAGQTLALRRADELLHELRTSPAKTPSDDWEPKVEGLPAHP